MPCIGVMLAFEPQTNVLTAFEPCIYRLGCMNDFVVPRPATYIESTSNGAIGVPGLTKPLRIMVVDDNVDSADLLGMFLRSEGHETHVEYGAIAALEIIGDYLPHIVIIDIAMPRVSGCDMVRQARTIPALQSTYFVALSGYSQPDIQFEALAAGFHRYVVKPCCVSILNDVIRKYQLI